MRSCLNFWGYSHDGELIMNNELYGEDFKLDYNLQAVVTANGELLVSNGVETVLQDLQLRLCSLKGSLFYDLEFGCGFINYVKDENTFRARTGMCAEVERCFNADPRVVTGSVKCEVLQWDSIGVSLRANFKLIEKTHVFNLIIKSTDKIEFVIKDINI